MKLSKAQQRTILKMSGVNWSTAYELQESLRTLDALVAKGLVKRNILLGASFSPRTAIEYKLLDISSTTISVERC